MCRSKYVEPSINFGLINSITKLHLVRISTEFPFCLVFDLHSSSCLCLVYPYTLLISFVLSRSYPTSHCLCLQGLFIICIGCYSEIVIRLTVSPEEFKEFINPHRFTYTFRDPPPEVTRLSAGSTYGQMMVQYNGLTAYIWVMAILFFATIVDNPVHHHVVSNMLSFP